MAVPWWRPLAAESRLSQGDVLADSTFALPLHPRTSLVKHVFSGGAPGWKESPSWQTDASGFGHCLGRGRVAHALVVTHSCQLDKGERTGRVLLAPISPIASVKEQDRDRIMAGERISFVPLPGIPELGDYYADLRPIMAFDPRAVEKLQRVATMSAQGVVELRDRIATFFMRPGEGTTGEIVQIDATFKGACESDGHANEMSLTRGITFPPCQSPGCGKVVRWKID
jgi:hypothetical protein